MCFYCRRCSSLTILGVIKIRSSSFEFDLFSVLNSQPRSGIFFNPGQPELPVATLDLRMPPITFSNTIGIDWTADIGPNFSTTLDGTLNGNVAMNFPAQGASSVRSISLNLTVASPDESLSRNGYSIPCVIVAFLPSSVAILGEEIIFPSPRVSIAFNSAFNLNGVPAILLKLNPSSLSRKIHRNITI